MSPVAVVSGVNSTVSTSTTASSGKTTLGERSRRPAADPPPDEGSAIGPRAQDPGGEREQPLVAVAVADAEAVDHHLVAAREVAEAPEQRGRARAQVADVVAHRLRRVQAH